MPRRLREASPLAGFLFSILLLVGLVGCGTDQTTPEISTISVSMVIHASAKDTRWFRNVSVPKGTDAFDLTEKVTEGDIQAKYYAAYRSHLVEALLGIKNQTPDYWRIYVWSESQNKWEPIPVGADLYSLKDGHVLAWYYGGPDDDVPSVMP